MRTTKWFYLSIFLLIMGGFMTGIGVSPTLSYGKNWIFSVGFIMIVVGFMFNYIVRHILTEEIESLKEDLKKH